MTYSRDKIAAVEKSRKKGVPCFEFDKVSYNARYTNIRGVKKALFSGFYAFWHLRHPFGSAGLMECAFYGMPAFRVFLVRVAL